MNEIEEVIKSIGWGLYHQMIIGISAVTAASLAAAWSTHCFALPMAFCDMTLTEKSLQNLGVILYFGISFGSCTLCLLSDIIERKNLFTSSLLICFLICLVASFAHGITMLEFCMFCLGSGLMATKIIMKVYLIEHLPMEKRGRYIILTDIIFGLSMTISALIASLMTPSVIHQRSFDMRIITWRLMFGLSGALFIILACNTALLKSSPRHLFFKREHNEALNTLKYIYAINNSKHSQAFEMRPLQLITVIKDYNLRLDPYATTFSDQVFDLGKRMFRSMILLFHKQFVVTTVALMLIRTAFPFEMIHVNLWLTHFLQHNKSSDCYVNSKDILYFEGMFENSRCKLKLSGSNYFIFVGLTSSAIFGSLFLYFLIDFLGRKLLLVLASSLCGASSVLLLLSIENDVVNLLLSLMLSLSYTTVLSILDIVTLENYPTAIRSTALIETQLPGKIYASLCLIFLDTNCRTTWIFMAASILVTALLGLLIQDLHKKPMVE